MIFLSSLYIALFAESSGRIIFTVAPVPFSKINPSFRYLAKAIAVTRLMAIVGVSTSVNCPRVNVFQSAAKRNYKCPVGCLWALGILPLVSSTLAC